MSTEVDKVLKDLQAEIDEECRAAPAKAADMSDAVKAGIQLGLAQAKLLIARRRHALSRSST